MMDGKKENKLSQQELEPGSSGVMFLKMNLFKSGFVTSSLRAHMCGVED
jgi:hypothetical protein